MRNIVLVFLLICALIPIAPAQAGGGIVLNYGEDAIEINLYRKVIINEVDILTSRLFYLTLEEMAEFVIEAADQECKPFYGWGGMKGFEFRQPMPRRNQTFLMKVPVSLIRNIIPDGHIAPHYSYRVLRIIIPLAGHFHRNLTIWEDGNEPSLTSVQFDIVLVFRETDIFAATLNSLERRVKDLETVLFTVKCYLFTFDFHQKSLKIQFVAELY